MNPADCEVAIVGAGLSGLSAARRLCASGVKVQILEARDRVGGRTLVEVLEGGAWIDSGGQWLSPGMNRMTRLCEEFEVELFPTYSEGDSVDWREGVRSTYQGMFPPSATGAENALLAGAGKLMEMAQRIPLESPWLAPDAEALDARTLRDWLEVEVPSRLARETITRAVQGVFAGGPGEVSLLGALFVAHSADPLNAFVKGDEGPEMRLVGGVQQLSERLAQDLAGMVRLGAPVHHIQQSRGGVEVFGEGCSVRAQRAIVTLPPPLAARIRYTPALPLGRDMLCQHAPMGWVIKVHCVYPEPFWRAAGLSGQISSDEGAIRVTADNSPPGGRPGILVGFIEGAEARRLICVSEQERRAAVVQDLVRYFGEEASYPLTYHETSWGSQPWSRGCYGGLFRPGVLTAYGRFLREPCGSIHWAGAESSATWNGKLEGALLSGERAAEEVMVSLG